jgi:DeoR/GlpR family transcriptional regulator of sugar metabolism
MIDVSDQLIVVADHTKLGRVCLMPVAPLKRVDCLVTDSGASAEMVEAIRANGPTVEIAEVET